MKEPSKTNPRQAQDTIKPHQVPPPEDMPTPEQLRSFHEKIRRDHLRFIDNLNRASRKTFPDEPATPVIESKSPKD